MVSDSGDGGNWGKRLAAVLTKWGATSFAFLWKVVKDWWLPTLISSAIIFVGGFSLVRGLIEQSEYEWTSYNSTEQYADDTYSPAYNACLRLAVDRQPDCISNANNEWRENERKEQDLVAQQTTAVWTFLMGMAAIIGVTLSAIGVYLVWTTFRETRKANDIAHDSNRPWLKISAPETAIVKFQHEGSDTAIVQVEVEVENLGNSPAMEPRLELGVFVNKGGFDSHKVIKRVLEPIGGSGLPAHPIHSGDSAVLGEKAGWHRQVRNGKTWALEKDQNIDDLYIAIVLTYGQIGRRECLYTADIFAVRPIQTGYHRRKLKDGNLRVHLKVSTGCAECS